MIFDSKEETEDGEQNNNKKILKSEHTVKKVSNSKNRKKKIYNLVWNKLCG